MQLKLGILPWVQSTDWPELSSIARQVDRLGYDYLLVWDHLYAIFGDPYQPIYEGWTTLGALATITERARIGLMVGANTFRNPALVAKSAVTLDHVSGGRAILGLGGAWFGLEHEAHGLDFGSGFGERLDRLDEACSIVRPLLDGQEVTHDGPCYRTERLVCRPGPVQPRLPIMIGGSGERKTLRTVARYADIWNGMGPVELMARKVDVLESWCTEVGRDPASIERTLACKLVIRDSEAEAERVWWQQMAHNRTTERDEHLWLGTPEAIAERIRGYLPLGFRTVIAELPAPFDMETIERFIGEVKPLVEAS
ncbi:MAG TPA: LLM class flavin-dependent oxidoreductase [Candidatus Limnocylindrales bacterium]|nr:LLM class flavin-dependent oxidoreductase [Candidatus Limnocylindrales bacterium]